MVSMGSRFFSELSVDWHAAAVNDYRRDVDKRCGQIVPCRVTGAVNCEVVEYIFLKVFRISADASRCSWVVHRCAVNRVPTFSLLRPTKLLYFPTLFFN
jgi:hypothetical protein